MVIIFVDVIVDAIPAIIVSFTCILNEADSKSKG
jgi:hypothetical protein